VDESDQRVEERVLICEECGRESPPGAVGWRACLGEDDEAYIFCPTCAAREFDID